MKYSNNKKLNTCLQYIEESLMGMCETEDESLMKIVRYHDSFPRFPDFNIVSYGNLLVSPFQIREFYQKCGYRSAAYATDFQIWETYKRQVGRVATLIIKEYG